MMPKTSIIIPCYNQARYILETLDSIRGQTRPPLETIVIDDGSTDDLTAVLAARRAEVTYYRQENRGPAVARNAGIRMAKGEYILFLDSDDLIQPTHLERLEQVLDTQAEYDVCYSDFRYFQDEDPSVLRAPEGMQRYSGHILYPLLAGSFIPMHCALCRRRAIIDAGWFDETLLSCEDGDLWIRMALRGSLFLYVPEPLALYRQHKNTRTRDRLVMWSEMLRVLDRVDQTLAQRDGKRDPRVEKQKRVFLALLTHEYRKVYAIERPLRCRMWCHGVLLPGHWVLNFMRWIGSAIKRTKRASTGR